MTNSIARMPRRPGPKRSEIVSASAGCIALAVAARTAGRGIDAPERALFRVINGWPDSLHLPLATLMQAGSFPSVWIAAAAVPSRRKSLAIAGTAAWLACKGVKQVVRRGRPESELPDVRIRGGRQRGLGFPSGHAAVSFSLASVLVQQMPKRVKVLPWLTAGGVAVARVYVGAHLPADIVGGAGIGLAIGALCRSRS